MLNDEPKRLNVNIKLVSTFCDKNGFVIASHCKCNIVGPSILLERRYLVTGMLG